jgi:hypothetical protein
VHDFRHRPGAATMMMIFCPQFARTVSPRHIEPAAAIARISARSATQPDIGGKKRRLPVPRVQQHLQFESVGHFARECNPRAFETCGKCGTAGHTSSECLNPV